MTPEQQVRYAAIPKIEPAKADALAPVIVALVIAKRSAPVVSPLVRREGRN